MRKHRNPRQRLSKHQIHHNPDAPTLVHSREACTMADLDAIRLRRALRTVTGGGTYTEGVPGDQPVATG